MALSGGGGDFTGYFSALYSQMGRDSRMGLVVEWFMTLSPNLLIVYINSTE